MKTRSFVWRAVYMCMAAVMACVLNVSCSSDDPVLPEPTPNPDNGEVAFEITNDSGTGTGTSTSPAEVSKGDTLNMVISQKSSYTDSDGSVFECEPKATIELFARLDTVYVDDLTKLTNVQAEPEVQSSKSGQNPVINEITQKFLIGDQDINFDLAYEVYNYTTVDGKTVEMPYVKLNQAALGGSGTTDASDPTARSETVMKSITVKPLPQTRASISDTTWYEVNATFNLEIECMNAKTENKQKLTFSVTYLGAVTTEIELGEAVGKLSTTIEALDGTNSVSSPYIVNPKEQMSLLFRQNSSYIDAYGNKMVCEPQARINLFAQYDTVYVSKLEELEVTPASQDFVFTESGEDPVLYSTVQLFKLGIQMIQLDMSYETYTAIDVENNEITMPYLKQNATMPGAVTVSEISTATGAKADTTFYNVKFPITLETVDVGTPDENIQTIELVVSYIGAIVTWKEEPELVKVEYRTGYVWEEAHDNLPLLYYAHVFRDRYYSTGEVITDTFVDNGHPMETSLGFQSIFPIDGAFMAEGEYKYSDDDIVIFHKGTMKGEPNDSIRTMTSIVEVDYLDSIEVREDFHPSPDSDTYPGKWDCYISGKIYEDGVYIPVDANLATQSYEQCSLPSGWYFQGFTEKADLTQVFYKDYVTSIYRMFMHITCYDQFLVIDGVRIDFLEYLPDREFNTVIESTPSGKTITREERVKFLGRNFYAACIMEFRQK